MYSKYVELTSKFLIKMHARKEPPSYQWSPPSYRFTSTPLYSRSSLRNRHNNKKSQENWNAFTKQRNRYIKMLRQTKIDYYKNLDIKCLMEVLVTDDKEVAEIFNENFVNITDSLGIIQPKDALQQHRR